MRCHLTFCFSLIFALFTFPLHAETAHVAAASNFTTTLTKLVSAFSAHSTHKIKVSTGSSGKLFAQIQHGAPYDVFLSADDDKPSKLVQANLAVANSQFSYAFGALVLWSTNEAYRLQLKTKLLSNQFNKLAIANPQLAPYGQAAQQVLQQLGLAKQAQAKLVKGENIGQTYQFTGTGNADLGFVALSQVLDSVSNDSYWIVPSKLYSPIRQDAVLLTRAAQNQAAQAFLDFLQSPQAKAIISKHGYRTL